MQDIFQEAGISVNPNNKKQIDRVIHQIVGVNYKDCSKTWKAVKQTFLFDEQKRHEFVQKLQTTVNTG
jgi:hypothetical protein